MNEVDDQFSPNFETVFTHASLSDCAVSAGRIATVNFLRTRATAKSFTESFDSDDACLPLDTQPKRGAVTRGERF
jgi:hypothetical protein